MNGQQWVKELRHRVNKANGEYYDVIELDFDEVDEIIELLKKEENVEDEETNV